MNQPRAHERRFPAPGRPGDNNTARVFNSLDQLSHESLTPEEILGVVFAKGFQPAIRAATIERFRLEGGAELGEEDADLFSRVAVSDFIPAHNVAADVHI